MQTELISKITNEKKDQALVIHTQDLRKMAPNFVEYLKFIDFRRFFLVDLYFSVKFRDLQIEKYYIFSN